MSPFFPPHKPLLHWSNQCSVAHLSYSSRPKFERSGISGRGKRGHKSNGMKKILPSLISNSHPSLFHNQLFSFILELNWKWHNFIKLCEISFYVPEGIFCSEEIAFLLVLVLAGSRQIVGLMQHWNEIPCAPFIFGKAYHSSSYLISILWAQQGKVVTRVFWVFASQTFQLDKACLVWNGPCEMGGEKIVCSFLYLPTWYSCWQLLWFIKVKVILPLECAWIAAGFSPSRWFGFSFFSCMLLMLMGVCWSTFLSWPRSLTESIKHPYWNNMEQ